MFATPQVIAALEHVRSHLPKVTQVFYTTEQKWLYLTDDGYAPAFETAVDISLLEDAVDSLDTFPRVDFPSTPGNYVQFYTASGGTIAELAQVSPSGQVVSIATSNWQGKVSLQSPVFNQTALFSECGLLTFREAAGGLVSSSFQRVSPKSDCPFNPVPVQWTRVRPAAGER